jgi:hypothetical protein
MLEALLGEGVDPSQLLPGTGTCAIPDTVRWTVRPPLVELTEPQTAMLLSTLQQAGFTMPGLQPA